MSTSKVQLPPTRRANKLVVWLGRDLLRLLALIVILALAGAVYQAVATQIDKRSYPHLANLLTWAAISCTSTAPATAGRAAQP